MTIKTPEQILRETDLILCDLYFQINVDPVFMVPFPLNKDDYDNIRKKYYPKEYTEKFESVD